VYRACIIDALAKTDGDTKNLTPNEIAKAISNALKLGRSIRAEAIHPYLEELTQDENLAEADGRYWLTEKGTKFATEERIANATGNLLQGRSAIRAKLEELLGEKLHDSDFVPLWDNIEAALASILYLRGERLVRATAAVLESSNEPEALNDIKPIICEMTYGAVRHINDATRRKEIVQAINDMLVEPTGPACQWLVKMCASFVALCSLGLESRTAVAIRKAVSTLELVLDTDVVLSLLCEGESLHRCTDRAVKLWRAEGGKLLMADPVVHEVAHHAWIAENDYREVETWFPGSDEDGHRMISNAFVRGFARIVRSGSAKKREWAAYIRQFKGSSKGDTTAAERQIKTVHTTQKLPTVKPERQEIGVKLLRSLEDAIRSADKIDSKERERRLDKARRDATLVASISQRRASIRETTSAGTCCLVSSSGRLRQLSQHVVRQGFRPEKHQRNSVVVSVRCKQFSSDLGRGIRFLLACGPRHDLRSSWLTTLSRAVLSFKLSSPASPPSPGDAALRRRTRTRRWSRRF
jgi:hypothetical protein